MKQDPELLAMAKLLSTRYMQEVDENYREPEMWADQQGIPFYFDKCDDSQLQRWIEYYSAFFLERDPVGYQWSDFASMVEEP